MFVRRSKYDALYARYQLALDAAAEARAERDAFRAAATTSARQAVEAETAETTRLREQVTALISERNAEQKRADRLQRRLDDAVGLNTAALAEGARWRERRQDKPKGARA